jgi:hypothetical protein
LPVEAQPVVDTDRAHYFGVDPAIDIEKSVQTTFDADTPDGPMVVSGGVVRWEFTVTNTGNVALTHVVVTDDQIANDQTINCGFGAQNVIPALSAGDSVSCVAFGTAIEGPYANLGTVDATGPETVATDGLTMEPGEDVTDTDAAHYFGAQPSIDIEKTVQGADADAPSGPLVASEGEVRFVYTVTNTGNVTLTDLVVTDDPEGTIDCGGITELAPSAQMTCTLDVTGVDSGSYQNTGLVTGVGPETVNQDGEPVPGVSVSDEDPANYYVANPAVDIEKFVQTTFDADVPDGPAVGESGPVLFTYLVTNTGTTALSAISVHDDVIGMIECRHRNRCGRRLHEPGHGQSARAGNGRPRRLCGSRHGSLRRGRGQLLRGAAGDRHREVGPDHLRRRFADRPNGGQG